MALLSFDCCCAQALYVVGNSSGWRFDVTREISRAKFNSRYGVKTKDFTVKCSAKNSRKKYSKSRKNITLETDESSSEENIEITNGSSSEVDGIQREGPVSVNSSTEKILTIPSRGAVLQACTLTSGLLAAFGTIIRQVSLAAFMEGLPVNDCTAEVSFGFETWHLELITGLVLLISSCRYVLLKTWPDFAESSEAANQQVLTSLEPADYLVVAFLPGISEELLFRGALLPAVGLNWISVIVVAAVFGALHLGSGRKYSFAIWATFVGFSYGCATIATGSIIVPMVSHSLNNLVGGILWRYESDLSK